MYSETMVLCGANAYDQKYYFNEDFIELPESIQQELQVMCVLFTADIGGVLSLFFDEEGSLQFKVEAPDYDYAFDEIGSALKIKEIQRTKQDLLESLELYYKVFFLGEEIEEEVK